MGNYFARCNYHPLTKEQVLYRAKQMACIIWGILFYCFIVCILTLLTASFILYKVNYLRGATVTFSSGRFIVTFKEYAQFDHVAVGSGILQSATDNPFKIVGNEVILQIVNYQNETLSKLEINSTTVTVSRVKEVKVKCGNGDKTVFGEIIENFMMPKNLSTLTARQIKVNNIVNARNKALSVVAEDGLLHLKGNKGITIKGPEVNITGQKNMYLKSKNGTIYFESSNIFFNLTYIPLILPKNHTSADVKFQYKLCICMPRGNIFRVPITGQLGSYQACSPVNLATNPCLEQQIQHDNKDDYF